MKQASISSRYLVVGAGPTGLGAAWRFDELGIQDWVVLESSDRVGGLAASFTDEQGFTYDVGGHVMFTGYDYYRNLVDDLLDSNFSEIRREATIWMRDRMVDYPFQSNLDALDPEMAFECLAGLIRAGAGDTSVPENFAKWIEQKFGDGIARHFMLPYNSKVWASPPESMAHGWISDRVQTIDIFEALKKVVVGGSEPAWGPNSTFRYPLHGGTGYLWEQMAGRLSKTIELNTSVVEIDAEARRAKSSDGRTWKYEQLLSTMPITSLVDAIDGVPDDVRQAVSKLRWTSGHMVGLGLDRPSANSANWIYYPQPEIPFYRLTYLSNYSPNMTPGAGQTILLTESSFAPDEAGDEESICEKVIESLIDVGAMDSGDRERILSTWVHTVEMSYPVPTVERDHLLGQVQPWLMERGIWSRGRFGAWLYEIGNMDHSVMQGVEFANAVALSEPETVWPGGP